MRCLCVLGVYAMMLSSLLGQELSFVAVDGTTTSVVVEHGRGALLRHAPCSTFKIVLSLIGFDLGILLDADTPEYPYDGSDATVEAWKAPHTPKSWIQQSVVWYSQRLAQQIGMERMSRYVALFDYGNQDLTGDRGQNNGLTHAWLSSSLKISPLEQTVFLHKLVTDRLPVSAHALSMTKQLLFCEELDGGWRLFAKTGTGFERYPDGSPNFFRKIAWFVGWIERGQRHYEFALNLSEMSTVPTKDERKEIVLRSFQEVGIL